MKFYVSMETLTKEIKTIRFHTIETDLSEKWGQTLKHVIDNNHPLQAPERIYNLNDNWNKESIFEKIKDSISNINNYQSIINPMIADREITQDTMNQMHDIFVDLMHCQFYSDSPTHIKEEISSLNILVHRYEGLGGSRRIVVTFGNLEYKILEDEHFNSFTLRTKPNDVTLDYCHAGKSILDVFGDSDENINKDHIVPQFNYSANFEIRLKLGDGYFEKYMKLYEQSWEENKDMLAQLGFYKHDPKCAIGKAPVARIIGDVDVIKNEIFGVQNIVEVGYV